jgi:hypothetical protein
MLLGGMPPPLTWSFDRLLAPLAHIFFGFKGAHQGFVSLGGAWQHVHSGSSSSKHGAAQSGIQSSSSSSQHPTAEL